MQLPSLLNQVLKKTAPMSATEQDRINNDCQLWYEKMVAGVNQKVKDGEVLTFMDKVIQQLDTWYVRTAIALSYFIIIRFIQDLMNPGDDHDPEDSPHS